MLTRRTLTGAQQQFDNVKHYAVIIDDFTYIFAGTRHSSVMIHIFFYCWVRIRCKGMRIRNPGPQSTHPYTLLLNFLPICLQKLADKNLVTQFRSFPMAGMARHLDVLVGFGGFCFLTLMSLLDLEDFVCSSSFHFSVRPSLDSVAVCCSPSAPTMPTSSAIPYRSKAAQHLPGIKGTVSRAVLGF